MAVQKLHQTISERSGFMKRGLTPGEETVHFKTFYVCHKCQ